ncbi:MAP3K epsilon protein kinase 1 [Diplonema papillatum]|nr:MAP3K epsilon protein kinase 1 [Diplonema papillatum]KAJ9452376.1 MAP3K epsilon protein kinase 1 [Diplonema papillatum]
MLKRFEDMVPEDASMRCFRNLITESVGSSWSDWVEGDSPRNELPNALVDRHGRTWHRSERRLGQGQFGEVWLGMDGTGGMTALKAIPLPHMSTGSVLNGSFNSDGSPVSPELGLRGGKKPWPSWTRQSLGSAVSADPNQSKIDRLVDEVNMLKHAEHPNIVKYLACFVTGGHAVVCMEYVAGGTLEGVLNDFANLPAAVILRYARDILSGLTCLHSHKIVHRDLKPANLLLTPEGQVKIADLGAAKELSQDDETTIGTPLYMSPEACRNESCLASDVWSFGIILCQLFLGALPYSFTSVQPYNPASFVRKLANDPTFGPDLPTPAKLFHDSNADSFLRSCLQANTAKRPTAKQLQNHPYIASSTSLLAKAAARRHTAVARISDTFKLAFPPRGKHAVRVE